MSCKDKCKLLLTIIEGFKGWFLGSYSKIGPWPCIYIMGDSGTGLIGADCGASS